MFINELESKLGYDKFSINSTFDLYFKILEKENLNWMTAKYLCSKDDTFLPDMKHVETFWERLLEGYLVKDIWVDWPRTIVRTGDPKIVLFQKGPWHIDGKLANFGKLGLSQETIHTNFLELKSMTNWFGGFFERIFLLSSALCGCFGLFFNSGFMSS